MDEITVTLPRVEAEALGFPLSQPSRETVRNAESAREKIRAELRKLYDADREDDR